LEEPMAKPKIGWSGRDPKAPLPETTRLNETMAPWLPTDATEAPGGDTSVSSSQAPSEEAPERSEGEGEGVESVEGEGREEMVEQEGFPQESLPLVGVGNDPLPLKGEGGSSFQGEPATAHYKWNPSVCEWEPLGPGMQLQPGWQPIEGAPKDRAIRVYAPGREGLPGITCMCEWHPDAGFCVDEVRVVTHWWPEDAPPRNEAEASVAAEDRLLATIYGAGLLLRTARSTKQLVQEGLDYVAELRAAQKRRG
jgi:hypothetical protein